MIKLQNNWVWFTTHNAWMVFQVLIHLCFVLNHASCLHFLFTHLRIRWPGFMIVSIILLFTRSAYTSLCFWIWFIFIQAFAALNQIGHPEQIWTVSSSSQTTCATVEHYGELIAGWHPLTIVSEDNFRHAHSYIPLFGCYLFSVADIQANLAVWLVYCCLNEFGNNSPISLVFLEVCCIPT